MLPPQVLYAGFLLGKKLFGALTGNAGSPPAFRYTLYAVHPDRLRAFAADHPDVVSAEDLYTRMRGQGMEASAADLAGDCARMERQHPDCALVCADFRR